MEYIGNQYITVSTVGCKWTFYGINWGGEEIWGYNNERGTFYKNTELYNGRVTFSGGPIFGMSHFYHTPSGIQALSSGNQGRQQWGFGMTIGDPNQATWKESDEMTPPYIDVDTGNSHSWGRTCLVHGGFSYSLDVWKPRICYACDENKRTTPFSNNKCMCRAGTFQGIDGICNYCPINT